MNEEAVKVCVFCNPSTQVERLFRTGEYSFSIISKPWFREGHCVVIPKRHIITISELRDGEASEIMKELGRLSNLLDQGFGAGVMQKYQPTQAENGIKVNHLHFHVFPRLQSEEMLFPVPLPNTFNGFTTPGPNAIAALMARLTP